MGCCGQKRSAAASAGGSVAKSMPAPQSTQAVKPETGSPAIRDPGPGAVVLRYLERSRVLVPGPVSGRHYEFSQARPLQPVDPRDAELLLATGFFARATRL